MPIRGDRISNALAQHGYVQLKKVGSGSFGQAILVQKTGDAAKEDPDKYICKMIDISRCTAKEKSDALREGQLLKTLKHPYIVRYRESFLEDGWLCIVMDYCEGGDLNQRIKEAKAKNRPFSEDQVTRWLTQATLALKYIHEKHILHRDLKSSNFFLSKNGNLKMGDFGIAKVLESTAACAKTQIGTPYYLSPEICMEKAYAWPSDIWAMGCILYEMAALKVPFDASDLKGLIQKITRGPTPSLPQGRYSDEFRDLSSELLQRDTKRRPGAAEILKRPLLQEQVRKLLGEAKGPENSSGADPAPSDNGSSAPLKEENSGNPGAAARQQQGVPKGPYAGAAGTYRKGEVVEYYSETHKEWLPAMVNSVDADGLILLNVKPNTKLSLEVQAERVRPARKQSKGSEQSPSVIRASENLQPNVPPWAQRPGLPRSNSRPGSRPGSACGTPRGGANVYTPRAGYSPAGRVGSGSGRNTPIRQRSPSPGGGGGAHCYPRYPSPGGGRAPSPAGAGGMVRCPSLPGSRGSSPMGYRAPSPRGQYPGPGYGGNPGTPGAGYGGNPRPPPSPSSCARGWFGNGMPPQGQGPMPVR